MIKYFFNISPVFVQNILISTYGYILLKRRYGSVYYKWQKIYLNKEYKDTNEEMDNQLVKLKQFINFAYNNSPFYKKFYCKVNLSNINSLEDLNLLPMLEKEVFRKNLSDIYTLAEQDAVVSYTGGTTGKSLKVLFTRDDMQKRMAYLDAFKIKVSGIDPFKSKKATFSGRQFTQKNKSTIFWRHNKAYNQRLYSTFDLTKENMPYYLSDLNTFKPDVINGFVSAIYELAKFIEVTNTKLYFVPQAIFTTSETLLPHHRELIERVFKAKIYNQYASAEGAPFITECIGGRLHYNLDTGVIEEIETKYGAEILITSFSTHGTPLIRYKIGDKIKFSTNKKCKCGSIHPLISSIEGRKVEFLLTADNNKVSLSHLADVIKGLPNNVINMQFIQKNIRTIIINLVVDKKTFQKSDEESILFEMNSRFGKTTNILFNYVEDIPREKSGKFSLIKNTLISTDYV